MNTIKRYVPTSNGDVTQKGTIENPYTEEEMNEMLDDETWHGGFVEDCNYVLSASDLCGLASSSIEIDLASVQINSERLKKTSLCTLSQFTATVYGHDGNLLDSESMSGFFLEPVVDEEKAEIKGSKTAIKPGTYKIVSKVPGQKYDWYLQGVPGREGIAIHKGNYYSNTDGCLLIGNSFSKVINEDAYKVINSELHLSKLSQLLNKYGRKNACISISEGN